MIYMNWEWLKLQKLTFCETPVAEIIVLRRINYIVYVEFKTDNIMA